MGLVVLNFSHPITTEQQVEIERLDGASVELVIDVPAQINHHRPFVPQIIALAQATGLSPTDWQTLRLAVNLPGYALAAGVLMAELHGRMGQFPTVLYLRPEESGSTTVFVVAGLVNLQALRAGARTRRQPAQKARRRRPEPKETP